MKKIMPFLCMAVLAGCGPSEPVATETVESLVADPFG